MECSEWTTEKQEKAVRILKGEWVGEKDRKYYHTLSKFKLVEFAGVTRVQRKKDGKLMATVDTFHTIIKDIHESIQHKGETKTHKKVQEVYSNIPMSAVKKVIVNCVRCVEKCKKKSVRSVVVRPITSSALNDRGQVDLIDYRTEPDGEYKWVLHYKEHLTKFSILRPLQFKKAALVARELLQIFLLLGAPHVLQSDNGREFCAEVITELASLWSNLVLVNGRPRHPESQGCVERSNATVKDSLKAWMRDNKTAKWATGLPFVQWGMNITHHMTIAMLPYEAVFGGKPRLGLASTVPREFLEKLTPGMLEEDLERMMSEDPQNEGDSRAEDVTQVHSHSRTRS